MLFREGMTASHAIPEPTGFRAGTPLLVTDADGLDGAGFLALLGFWNMHVHTFDALRAATIAPVRFLDVESIHTVVPGGRPISVE